MKFKTSYDPNFLVLASSSPRRKNIISSVWPRVPVLTPSGNEQPRRDNESPAEMVVRIALQKARDVESEIRDGYILSADTVVVLGDKILGKPRNRQEAVIMLEELRGGVHQVITGVVLLESLSGLISHRVKVSDVEIRMISDLEIERYVDSGESFDKAGGYAIQDTSFKPANFILGCYLNVVGLPMCSVIELIKDAGIDTKLSLDCDFLEKCVNGHSSLGGSDLVL